MWKWFPGKLFILQIKQVEQSDKVWTFTTRVYSNHSCNISIRKCSLRSPTLNSWTVYREGLNTHKSSQDEWNWEVSVNKGFHCFKVSFMGKIEVRCWSCYGCWLSSLLPLPTPYRFHLVVVWRGSGGLGKISESMLAQFPPGLRSLQGPHREWSASTKLRMCAFDLYSMTITHMENVLSQRGCVWSRVTC